MNVLTFCVSNPLEMIILVLLKSHLSNVFLAMLTSVGLTPYKSLLFFQFLYLLWIEKSTRFADVSILIKSTFFIPDFFKLIISFSMSLW